MLARCAYRGKGQVEQAHSSPGWDHLVHMFALFMRPFSMYTLVLVSARIPYLILRRIHRNVLCTRDNTVGVFFIISQEVPTCLKHFMPGNLVCYIKKFIHLKNGKMLVVVK
jgi:hypothetical protein